MMVAVPYVEQCNKVRSGVLEWGVDPVRLRGPAGGSFPGVLNTQCRCNDGYLPDTLLFMGLEDHSGNFWIHGHPCHEKSLFREGVVLSFPGNGPQFHEGIKPILDASLCGGVNKGKGRDTPQFQKNHAQDDLSQVGSKNFRRRKFIPCLIILFRIEPDTCPFLNPAAAPLSLVCAASGDRSDGEACGPGAGQVSRDAGKPRINDIGDPRDGQGGLCHVGGHYNLSPLDGIDPALLPCSEPGKEGKDGDTGVPSAFDPFTGLQDILLGWHKDQNIAGEASGPESVHRLDRHIHVGLISGVLE